MENFNFLLTKILVLFWIGTVVVTSLHIGSGTSELPRWTFLPLSFSVVLLLVLSDISAKLRK